uniref:Secreted protein n=1 Tax=Panagrellus redivivus TaxID=6233 RepID=A0A7E4W4P1_PANRE
MLLTTQITVGMAYLESRKAAPSKVPISAWLAFFMPAKTAASTANFRLPSDGWCLNPSSKGDSLMLPMSGPSLFQKYLFHLLYAPFLSSEVILPCWRLRDSDRSSLVAIHRQLQSAQVRLPVKPPPPPNRSAPEPPF